MKLLNKLSKALFATLIFSTTLALQAAEPKLSPLWKIQKNGKTSFILGTVHEGVSIKSLPPAVQQVIQNSSQIFLEVDLEKTATPDPTLVFLPEGQSLEQMISTKAWAKLTQILSDMDSMALNDFTPFLAYQLYYQKKAEQLAAKSQKLADQLTKTPGAMEIEIYLAAKAANQKLNFLEEVMVQIKMVDLDKFDPKKLEQTILKSDVEFEKELIFNYQHIRKLQDLYNKRDFANLEKLLAESDIQKNKDRVFTDRHANWLPIMETAMQEDNQLFAVGIAHMFNTEALVSLLQQRGYTVEQMPELSEAKYCDGILQ